ncbi:MAG: hypothetical protein SGPRY_012054, partial [Prymnesium sp.]
TDVWRCFYYGNDGTWADEQVKPFIPTGSCGMATSVDGISWDPVAHSTFGPNPEKGAWDSLHVGVGDVMWEEGEEGQTGKLVMYYFGADAQHIEGGPPVQGLRMRIGRAVSSDGGLSWEREGAPVLEEAAEEGLFASWPRVLSPKETGGPWRMLYHAFDGSKWRAFSARSEDGKRWDREGSILGPGPAGSFDERGVGTRCVAPWRGKLLMVYEGVEAASGMHQLGCALSEDGGASWSKMDGINPILSPGGAGGRWTSLVVGTPYLVPLEGGGLRLYFCAKEAEPDEMCIGALESVSGELSSDAWQPCS